MRLPCHILLADPELDQPQKQRAGQAPVLAVGRHGQAMPLPPLEQLIQREFQQRQRALLPVHLEQQRADQVSLEQQARIRNKLRNRPQKGYGMARVLLHHSMG